MKANLLSKRKQIFLKLERPELFLRSPGTRNIKPWSSFLGFVCITGVQNLDNHLPTGVPCGKVVQTDVIISKKCCKRKTSL